jgi:hypothetical protein
MVTKGKKNVYVRVLSINMNIIMLKNRKGPGHPKVTDLEYWFKQRFEMNI